MGGAAIGIAGTGAVAQAMGRLLLESGQPVVAVGGRAPDRVQQAASFIGAGRGNVEAVAIENLPAIATRVLIAVSDSGLADVVETLARAGFTQGTALHTCGAQGSKALEPLRRSGVSGGVIHPLQTVVSARQGVQDLQHISFGLGGDPEAVAWGREIITLLSGREIAVAPDRMAVYHAGAVMASNAMVALLDSAIRLMALAGVDEQDALNGLRPLSLKSVENALNLGPRAALTGPIGRGDSVTVRAHVAALSDAPDTVRALYRASGDVLIDLARSRGVPETRLREIAAGLNQLEKS